MGRTEAFARDEHMFSGMPWIAAGSEPRTHLR
jgi:hypothetical protein